MLLAAAVCFPACKGVVAVVTKLARGSRGCALQVANPRFGTAAQQESTCGAGPVFFIDRASGTNLALRYDFTFFRHHGA